MTETLAIAPRASRPDRRPRRAAELVVDDYVHDALIPMRITTVKHVGGSVRVEGLFNGITRVGAFHPRNRRLDVTRIV